METSLPGYREIKLNVLDSVGSRIRRGSGTETYIILYELLASLSCPDLKLINDRIHFGKDEKLGVGGKGRSIFDGDDGFYLLNRNKNNSISNSSPVFGSNLVVWGY